MRLGIRLLFPAAICAALTSAARQTDPAQQPGAKPELFGEGVFSTEAWDFFVALTPDQRTAYFCRANGTFSYFTILVSDFRNGRWSTPRVAPFSGRWSDADPHISPDGSRLFFISNRPITGDSARDDYDIWYVNRTAAGWSEPIHVPAPISRDDATEWSPSVAANGNLYFGAVRPGGKGANDLYLARWVNGAYAEPENLGDSINSPRGEVEPWIAPDESYLIFSGQGREGGVGGFDLWLAKRVNGVWQKPYLIGNDVNSPSGDFNQSVSPDGEWFYFSSSRSWFDRIPARRLEYAEMQRRLTSPGNGLGDIYRIRMREILR